MPRSSQYEDRQDGGQKTRRKYPQDAELEMSVLGSCITQSQWWSEIEQVTGGGSDEGLEGLFYGSSNSMVARAISRAKRISTTNDVNLTTVRSAYASMVRDGEESESEQVVLSYVARAPFTDLDQFKGAIARLNELQAKRRLIEGLKEVEDSLYEFDSDPYEATEKLRELSIHGVVSEPALTAKEVLARIDSTEVSPWQVDTGIPELNKLLGGGFEPGRLSVCAARPKIGKTTFGLNSAIMSCVEQDIVTLFVSLEMNDREIASKMLANLSSVEHRDVAKILNKDTSLSLKDLSTSQKEAYLNAYEDMEEAPLHFMFAENTKRGVNDIVDTVMTLRGKYGVDRPIAVFFDYLQLAVQDKSNARPELDNITRRLKLMALEHNVAVITFSQINRSGAEGGMPSPHQMRDSGGIEQDADVVIMMNREDANSNGEDDDDNQEIETATIDFWLALNRNGPTGMAHAEWVPGTSTILPMDEGETSFTRNVVAPKTKSPWNDEDDAVSSRPRRASKPMTDDDEDDDNWRRSRK